MKNRPAAAFAFALLLAAAAIFAPAAARAGDITYPKDTKPAFTFKLPDDWVSNDGAGGNLEIKSADSLGVVSLIVIDDADAAKMPLDEFGKQVFTAAGLKSVDKQEPDKLAGVKGLSLYGAQKVGDATVNVKVTIIHLDTTHLAVLTRGTNSAITPEELAIVNKVIASAKYLPAK